MLSVQYLLKKNTLTDLRQRQYLCVTSSQFTCKIAGMEGAERQQSAFAELFQGNIPSFLRQHKLIRLSQKSSNEQVITTFIWVLPNYQAIGDDNLCCTNHNCDHNLND